MKGVFSFVKKAYNTTIGPLIRRFVSFDPTPSRRSSTNTVFISILSPFETYVVSLQSLLIWERPYISAVSFVLLNCLFWLVVSWNRRFISILSLITLGIYVYRVWINKIWPEIRIRPSDDSEEWIRVHPKVLSVPELGHYLNDFVDKLTIWWNDMMKLRQANHGLFCLLGCAAFTLLALVGHVIPGVLIIYGFVLALSLGPGIVLHLIPTTIYDQIAGLFIDEDVNIKGSKKACDNDSDLEEFLPEQSAELLKQLSINQDPVVCSVSSLIADEEEQDELHLTTIRELGMDSFICESEESSLYTGLGGFPSVEEENESDLEEEDAEKVLPSTMLSEASSSVGIHFVHTHFKEDSSESESDAVFTEGLSFKNVPDIKEDPATADGTTQDLPGSKKEDTAKPKVSTSSDLDEELLDFEILEESDIS